MRFFVITFLSTLILSGCANPFKNHRNESFDFSIQTFTVGDPSPTVLLSHGSGCLQQSQFDWAKQVNSWGFNAIVIDHCSIRGITRYTGGVVPETLQPEHRSQDYVAIAEWVKTQVWHSGRLAVIGFSRGGEGVTNLVDEEFHERRKTITREKLGLIDVAVAFYPACGTYVAPVVPLIPTLIHHGKKDTLTEYWRCRYDRLKNPKYKIILYDGAGHGFDINAPDMILSNGRVALRYNAEADRASREITKTFLDEHLKN